MNSVIKSVRQRYVPTHEVLWLLEQFGQMLNVCVRTGLAENVTSLKSLSLRAYKQLSGYEVMSYYKHCAISAATGILRSYRKAKRKNPRTKEPYAHRSRLTTYEGFKLQDDELLLPFKPKQPIPIALNLHTLEVLSEPDLQVRSVTLTNDILSISYMRKVESIEPCGLVALDRNVENVTLADSNGQITRHDLSEATRVKAMYREVRSHMTRNDHRIRRQVSAKYGCKQREKVKQILHHASKRIVMEAKEKQFGIVMEKLTGIRKLYRRGNWQGHNYRGRMNSWSYFELQRQIEYKAKWEGLPVIYVPPHGTSSKCSICGHKMMPEENRTLRCPSCGYTVDRDVNAAKNILARGMRFVPIAPASEAMVQEPACAAILKVDADESNPREN